MPTQRLAQLSIKDLKTLITSAGLSFAGLAEKPDLVERAASALTSSTFGPYRCILSGTPLSQPCTSVVIFFHGYGADPSQFEFLRRRVQRDDASAWICPKSNGVGWWDLKLEEWQHAFMSGRIQQKLDETPVGLEDARANGLALIRAARLRAGPEARIILGGFSQGAMLATDLALSLEPEEGAHALFVLSGFPICVPRWKERAKLHAGRLAVLQTHGKNDLLLPFVASGWLKDVFEAAGIHVDFVAHNGAHDLGDESVLNRVAMFYGKQVAQAQQEVPQG